MFEAANTTSLSAPSQPPTSSMTLIGTYIKAIRRNFSNGYTVFYVSCKGFDEFKIDGRIMCKGYLPITTNGVPLKLCGIFKQENSGIYFFDISESSLYSDKKEITLEYILNIKIKGIGPKTAEKIVEITGPDIFSYIKQENALENLKKTGLQEEKIRKLIEVINETHFEKQIFEYVKRFGGTYLHSQNLFDRYHSDAINQIKKAPYFIGRSADIPFIVCDAIARKEGFTPYNKNRLQSLVFNALYSISHKGHTISSLPDIYKEVKFLIKNSAFPETAIPCSTIACALCSSRFIKQVKNENKTVIYALKEFDDAEEIIAENIAKTINSIRYFPIDITKEIPITEEKLHIKYSDKQKETFNFLLSSGIKILTGGPGTGKSTVVNGLIDIYKRYKPSAKIFLCAPTGRAAQKMKEITGHKAFTIHRLLNIQPYKSERDEIDYADVECLDADLIIIDEVSMVDTKLFAYITSAVPSNAIVVLCGDTFQLPSVGAGNILHDLISLNLFDIVMLDVIHRQKGNSEIVALSQGIKNGDISSFIGPHRYLQSNEKTMKLYGSPEVQIIETETAQTINESIVMALQNRFFKEGDKYFINNILELQVLSSTKKNNAGTVELNKSVKSVYSHVDNNENTTFSVGDKIMMIENNYDIGYYNGDIGIIKYFNMENNSVVVEIDGKEYEIPHNNIQDISLAYACTIHKSQGSEYQYVIIALPKEPSSILQRNLIYTAVTRAKKYVAIISEQGALQTAINKNHSIQRKTNLKHKILSKII